MTIWNLLDPTNPLHRLLHHLDLMAAAFTASSTALLATRRRSGFIMLAIGAVLWAAVARLATFGGRPVWGMALSSAWTFSFAVYGWRKWAPYRGDGE